MWLDYTVAKPTCSKCKAYHNVCGCDLCGKACTYGAHRGGFICQRCGYARTICKECLRIPFPVRSPHGKILMCWECAAED